MITWETIVTLYSDEKKSSNLAKISPDFFEEAESYLSKKMDLGRDPEEIENIKRILREIIILRIQKMTTLSLMKREITVADREKSILENIVFNADPYMKHLNKYI